MIPGPFFGCSTEQGRESAPTIFAEHSKTGGQVSISLDVSAIENERFELTGRNAENYKLYSDLGYRVITVPEYLHYMMGGVHCFVNIFE